MIKPFEYYLKENLVRKSSPNISMAKSLLEKARIRLARTKNETIDEDNSSIIFEDIYESLREATQSFMELKGYKPYSHEALISFLKEGTYLDEGCVHTLDHYRILRNNSVYKAEHVSKEKCTEALHFARKKIPEIKKMFERLTKG